MRRVRHIVAKGLTRTLKITLEYSGPVNTRDAFIERMDEIAGEFMLTAHKVGFPLAKIRMK